MSHHDYRASQEISAADLPFYALIMAAMRQADTANLILLQDAFPEVWAELDARYNAAGGAIPGDTGYDEIQLARQRAFTAFTALGKGDSGP